MKKLLAVAVIAVLWPVVALVRVWDDLVLFYTDDPWED